MKDKIKYLLVVFSMLLGMGIPLKATGSVTGLKVENTFVFDDKMDMADIQAVVDSIYPELTYPEHHFSIKRYALLFKPGVYHLDVRVGYYTHVMGLGKTPEEVTIVGAVRSNCDEGGHVLCNFWRAVENLTIIPTADDKTNTWAVSQAAPLRRVHIKGNLKLFEGASSGGFMANCKVDGIVFSGSQQQWFTRNSEIGSWNGGVWNMVYVGVKNAPKEDWPNTPVTIVDTTPLVKEKPYWIYSDNKYSLVCPQMRKETSGINGMSGTERTIPLKDFYLVSPGTSAAQINQEIQKGRHILFLPGIHHIESPIVADRKDMVLMGIGMASLVPTRGTAAIEVSDLPGITVAGLMIDASIPKSDHLMKVGEGKSNHQTADNPVCLYDMFFRVGGAHEGKAESCMIVNSDNVLIDHIWLWRADHGNGVAWNQNTCANGLVVNGNRVTAYALFNEHFQEYQTIWNGEDGRVYMYQSEMPYDPPTPEGWKHGETYGYAPYKVADHVKRHHAWGVGIYNVFFDAPIVVDQAIETPKHLEKSFYHKVIFWLNGHEKSFVKSVINGKGKGVNKKHRKSTMP